MAERFAWTSGYARERLPIALAFTAVATGMLAGTKYYALGYAAISWVVLIAAASTTRPRLRRAIVATHFTVAWGGYWYLRNLLVSGTPVFPLGASAPDGHVLPAYPDTLWRSTLLGCGHPETLKFVIRAVFTSAGPWFGAALLAAPLSAGWVAISAILLFWRKQQLAAALRLTLAGVFLASALVCAVTPFAAEDYPGTFIQLYGLFTPAQYGMAVWALCTLSAAILLHDVAVLCSRIGSLHLPGSALCSTVRPPRTGLWHSSGVILGQGLSLVPVGVLIVAAAWQVRDYLRPTWQAGAEGMLPPLVFLLLAVSVWACAAAWPLSVRKIALGWSVAVVIGGTIAIPLLGQRWHRDFAAHYDHRWQTTLFTDHFNDINPPFEIVCVLTPRVYPFFGSARQYRLCQPFSVPSAEALLEYLGDRRAETFVLEVIFHVPGEPGGTTYNADRGGLLCLEKHPESLQPISLKYPWLYYRINLATATSARGSGVHFATIARR
jgi:hypothetical protein